MGQSDDEVTAFVVREFPRLVGALDLYVGDLGVAEELAQEALMRACARWRHVSTLQSPGGWTYRVGINLASSHLRRRQAEVRARRRVGLLNEAVDDEDIALRDTVRAAVLTLPKQQRSVVILRYFFDLSAVTTAELLGVSPEAVRAATARAARQLRVDLGDLFTGVGLEES